jgi:alpha-glucosidase
MKWWQEAVFYQIYPRSFADGDGDGIGDFMGIIEQLDYLQDLGVDALWLSPHYPSPIADCGYDISDYTNVAPEYGSLDVFNRFLEHAHNRGLRVILDLVLNHTSEEHTWFLESRAKRDNPKRNWYVWHDGVNGGPPNNWHSCFGGNAWEYDSITDQYYYHYFLKEQPDLNWNNPQVKQAMWDAARFWLDMGVDGFRLDAIGTIFEDPLMPDHTFKGSLNKLHSVFRTAKSEEERSDYLLQWKEVFKYQVEQPGVHELMQELRAIIDQYDDRVLVGESSEIAYYGDGTNELHLVFNFPLMKTSIMTSTWVRDNQKERLHGLPAKAWPCNTLNNHDSSRVFTAFGDGQNDAALARLSLALILTLRGTPFIYNGEEIGMTDLLLTDIDEFMDAPALILYEIETQDLGIPSEDAFDKAALMSRDRCRTPMQWSNAPNAGFTPAGINTWLPTNPNYSDGVNVSDQQNDPTSLLNFYKRMLHVRKQSPALKTGDYLPINAHAENYLAFARTNEEQTCLVALNYSDRTLELDFSKASENSPAKLLFSSREGKNQVLDLARVEMIPFEILICEI